MTGTPQNPLDVLLVGLWGEVLGRPVGIRESLAALGASRGQIERLRARVERELGLSVPLAEWDPPGTIEALAAVLVRVGAEPRAGAAPASPRETGGRPRVLTRNAAGSRPPFVFLHGDFNGRGLYCLRLAAELGADQPLHALMPHGVDGEPIPESVEAMAEDRLALLRALQPAGPYRLGGHCNGGLVAFEMARRLEARGDRVATLVLVASDVRSHAPVPAGRRGLQAVQYYWHRLRQGPRAAAPPADTPGGRAVAERTRAQAERLAAYERVLLRYAPEPYRGPVLLLWPEQDRNRHPDDSTQGWGAVAPALEVRSIPGGHLSSVTTHVATAAAEIRRALDRG